MTKKTTQPKPLTKIELLEREAGNYVEALYMAYDDSDEAQAVLWLIMQEAEKDKDSISLYRLRESLKALRSLLISQQSLMMDCAGLEY